MRYMAASRQPGYLQLLRPKVGKIFETEYAFDPERAVTLQEGRDVTLVSTGYMTQFTLPVADELSREGLSVEVLHYPSVKPLDAATLVRSAQKTRGVVTVENQNILGGLGGAVCEVLSEQCPTRRDSSRHSGPLRRSGDRAVSV